jgi:hypothetical protein
MKPGSDFAEDSILAINGGPPEAAAAITPSSLSQPVGQQHERMASGSHAGMSAGKPFAPSDSESESETAQNPNKPGSPAGTLATLAVLLMAGVEAAGGVAAAAAAGEANRVGA